MRKLLAAALVFLMSHFAHGQVQDPVSWAFSAKKLNATTYAISMTATLAKGWHLYSQFTPDGGPVATAVAFSPNPLLVLEGTPKEVGQLEQKYEPLFGVEVKQFSGKVEFVQVVKVKGKAKTALNGSVDFMTCNDSQCLPPKTQKFSIALK